MLPNVVFGILGNQLDRARGKSNRWEGWRPSVAICQRDDFLVERLELMVTSAAQDALRDEIVADIAAVSPETTVNVHDLPIREPWDFEAVYAVLHDFARAYPFDPEAERYLVNITTGTHVMQICFFLLTEARFFPGELLQASPPRRRGDPIGEVQTIDLDLSRYAAIAQRFTEAARADTAFLKGGIQTRNAAFNALIEELEAVAARATDPILLTGPTGAGKSQLARRVYQLRRHHDLVRGPLVEVNCATLRGDAAMAALFGHTRGAFTGASTAREGLLRAANGGVLFLDEIGELGTDEQAMLLRALETGRFLPLGADHESESTFQLIAGTNRELSSRDEAGAFRDDLLARIDTWTYRLPGLDQRREDIEPNIDFELERYAEERASRIRFDREARRQYLAFALSDEATWRRNFRDLRASVLRMATLASTGRITSAIVAGEIIRLARVWHSQTANTDTQLEVQRLVPRPLDRFDATQLADVVRVCRGAASLSAAGRELFAVSRESKRQANDADRLRKYLARFGLTWQMLHGEE